MKKQSKAVLPTIIINIFHDDDGYYHQICTDGYIYTESVGPFLHWLDARNAAHAIVTAKDKKPKDASTQE